MAKSAARQQAESLNGVAAKVLSVVPLAEPWTVSGICSELFRHGSRIDLNIVQGCLRALVSSGHVKENPLGMFRRTTVASSDEPMHAPTQPAPSPKVIPMPVPAPPERSSLDTIGAFAQRLRETGRALIVQAEELERLGLEYEERLAAASVESPELAKLRQLKSLLSSLT